MGHQLRSPAARIVKEKLDRAAPALVKPYTKPSGLRKIISSSICARSRAHPRLSDLLAAQGGFISQVVRGETQPLSDGERQEILQSRISYYPNDLAVIGWNAAFLYDSPSGAETAIQLLQYANSQLLEFRHYDNLLTKQLEDVYDFLEAGGGVWRRWRTARAASKLHTVLLDVSELTERADNAIKFLSDMFSARLYKLAALKVGVPDYKDLVQEKLQTAEDLYRFMVDEFNQSRAFVLELMVVVILIVELIYFFRGKPNLGFRIHLNPCHSDRARAKRGDRRNLLFACAAHNPCGDGCLRPSKPSDSSAGLPQCNDELTMSNPSRPQCTPTPPPEPRPQPTNPRPPKPLPQHRPRIRPQCPRAEITNHVDHIQPAARLRQQAVNPCLV